MAIIVSCTCGKSLKVDEKYRGKRATCPVCGASLTVVEGPQPTAEPTPTPAPAAAPTKPKKAPVPAAAPAQDDANPFAVPPDDSLQKRYTKRSKLPWIILGCFGFLALLGCCSGAGYGLRYKFQDKITEAVRQENT